MVRCTVYYEFMVYTVYKEINRPKCFTTTTLFNFNKYCNAALNSNFSHYKIHLRLTRDNWKVF